MTRSWSYIEIINLLGSLCSIIALLIVIWPNETGWRIAETVMSIMLSILLLGGCIVYVIPKLQNGIMRLIYVGKLVYL